MLAGALIALSPAPFAIAGWAWRTHVDTLPAFMALALTVLLLVASLLTGERPRAALPLILLALVGCVALLWPAAARSPRVALLALLGLAWAIDGLWRRRRAALPSPGEVSWHAVVRGALAGALLLWLATALSGWQHEGVVVAAVFVSQGIALLFLLPWWLGAQGLTSARGLALLVALALALLLLLARWGQWSVGLGGFAAALGLAAWWLRLPPVEELNWWEPVLENPQRLLAVTFLGLCIGGAVLLALPISPASGRSVGPLDAAFTAVSAVCVTGLTVKDTALDFAGPGQAIILLLIQAGGLGIMTFSTAAMRLLGRRMSLRQEGAVAGLLSAQDRGHLYESTQRLLYFTFGAEALGALLLLPAFLAAGDGFAAALWRAVFTAVSAFCNAGFALQSDSLVGYQQTPWVLHVTGALIIAGALSPGVALALRRLRGVAPLSAQEKLGLTSTALLLVIGSLTFVAVEWNGALASLSWGDRLHNAWFQSATLRTAGFNSIDFGGLSPATLTVMMLWMFIGGNPGGTAGGIKTSTAAILLLGATTAVRGNETVVLFGRQVPQRTVYRAAAIATVALGASLLALLVLQLTQGMSTRLLGFEVVSALGTVGLTLGATAALGGIGKIVIIVCMFVGRIGSLTLFMFLSQRGQSTRWRHPEEEIDVG